jgi:hypothetical protein
MDATEDSTAMLATFTRSGNVRVYCIELVGCDLPKPSTERHAIREGRGRAITLGTAIGEVVVWCAQHDVSCRERCVKTASMRQPGIDSAMQERSRPYTACASI